LRHQWPCNKLRLGSRFNPELELVSTQFTIDAASQHNVVRCDVTQLPALMQSFTYWLFKVFVTSYERPFSTLRRLKTCVRNSMGEERLTGLAMMNIHLSMTLLIASPPRSEKFHLFCTCSCKSYLIFLHSIKNFPLLKYFI